MSTVPFYPLHLYIVTMQVSFHALGTLAVSQYSYIKSLPLTTHRVQKHIYSESSCLWEDNHNNNDNNSDDNNNNDDNDDDGDKSNTEIEKAVRVLSRLIRGGKET